MTYDPATRDPASAASRGRSYDVGYGKPPHHTRFQKGQSGNPGGRPRGSGTERVTQLALDEAYREVAIDEDGEAITMPAIQAVLRAQLALAAKGNGPAQRAVLKMVQDIETERAAIDAEEAARLAPAARRTTYLRRLAEEEARYEREAQAAGARTQATDASGARPGESAAASAPTVGLSGEVANSATRTGRTDEAVAPTGGGEALSHLNGGSFCSPPPQPVEDGLWGEGEAAAVPNAIALPQGRGEERGRPVRTAQDGFAQDGRRTSPPQTQRRDTAYDRLPWPERAGVEDWRKRPDGGSGRFRTIAPPAADEAPRPRGAPICDYPGASRTKRQSQQRGTSP
jgi:uncharacterized protein DUF5681